MVSSQCLQSQHNSQPHCRAISKPLVNAEKCNKQCVTGRGDQHGIKIPCTGKKSFPLEF